MKRETAVKYIHEIARRVRSVNGVLSTPNHSYSWVRISRVWVFGSTAKGAENPNDLDIFIELKTVGKYNRHGLLDKRYLRAYGFRRTKTSEEYALKWLTKGMRMVSRHLADGDEIFSTVDVKTLIYPRMDFMP